MVWIDNSKILGIFAVILLHVAAAVVIGNNIGSEYWWIGNLYDSLVRWCIPVFVMISGALLLDPEKKEGFSEFYKKRCAKIMIPLFFWSAFYLYWTHAKIIIMGNNTPFPSIITSLLSGAPYYHMWYLYMIVSLYLFTPFFRKIIFYSTKRELVMLVCFTFVMASINYAYEAFYTGITKLFINWFLFFIPYFFIGHLIHKTSKKISNYTLIALFLLSVITTSLGCYFCSTCNNPIKEIYFYGYLSITVIPMSISVMFLLKNWSVPLINRRITRKLSLLSLGAYLIHPIPLELLISKKAGFMSFHPTLSVPVISVVVLISSFFLAWIIHHIPYLRRII